MRSCNSLTQLSPDLESQNHKLNNHFNLSSIVLHEYNNNKLTSPHGYCSSCWVELSIVIIFHKMTLSIDVSTFCCSFQALQSSLSVLTYTLSIEIHNTKHTLWFQTSIAACFWMPEKGLNKKQRVVFCVFPWMFCIN